LGHTEQAIDFLTKARAANPKLDSVHFNLAAALGLRGDLPEARAALAAAISLKPDLNSLAAFRASSPAFNSSPFWALIEKTLVLGLRRVGFPDE
jgi:Flp pilus assembly protein TadD